jgi:uncharacterized protein with HEPN domain
MRDHAREAVAMIAGKSRSDLDDDRKLNLALVRLLEVVGEAANRISASNRAKHSEIPWKRIVGLRNRLIHGHDTVDFDVLWQIINRDLPPLIKALEKIVTAD